MPGRRRLRGRGPEGHKRQPRARPGDHPDPRDTIKPELSDGTPPSSRSTTTSSWSCSVPTSTRTAPGRPGRPCSSAASVTPGARLRRTCPAKRRDAAVGWPELLGRRHRGPTGRRGAGPAHGGTGESPRLRCPRIWGRCPRSSASGRRRLRATLAMEAEVQARARPDCRRTAPRPDHDQGARRLPRHADLRHPALASEGRRAAPFPPNHGPGPRGRTPLTAPRRCARTLRRRRRRP